MFPNANVDDVTWTLLAMQYGQIITHDMGLIDGTTQSSTYRALFLGYGKRCGKVASLQQQIHYQEYK